jgi:mycoredoxin
MITFYGTPTCVDCFRSKTFLEKHKISFDYIDITKHSEAIEQVESLNGGLRITPTIVFEDSSVLAEPSNQQLADKLGIIIDKNS